MLEEEPEVDGPAQWLGVRLNRLAIRLPLPHLDFWTRFAMCPVLLLSTHGQVLKDSAAPALAVKFNNMKFRNHNVARDLQKGSNVDEMLLNSISAHHQSVFTFPVPFPIRDFPIPDDIAAD
jgi:hypothetical protein